MKKKDVFLSTIKGFITGISALIPGISPAGVILSLNSYDDFIDGFSNIKKNKKVLLLASLPLLIGIVIGLLVGTDLVNYFISKYRFQTILLFVGLMFGGFKINLKHEKIKFNVKTIMCFVIAFLVSILFYILFHKYSLNGMSIYLKTIILGIFMGLSFVIPSITFKSFSLLDYGVLNIIIYIIFALITLFVFIKIISKVLNKYRICFKSVLLGLLLSSIIIAILHIGKIDISFVNIFTSILAFMWGYILALNIINE